MNSFLQSLKSFFLNSIPHKITFFSLIFLLLSTQCHSQDFAATAKEVVVDAVEDLTQNPATPVGTTIKVAGAIGLTIKAVGDAVGLAQDTNNTNNNTNTNNTEVHSINGKPVSGKVDVIVNNGSYSAEEPTDGIQHDESNPILTQIGGATPNPQPEDPKKPDDRNDKLVFEKCCKKHIESSDHKRQGLFEKGGQDIDNTAKEIIKRVHKNMKLPNGHTTIRCKINIGLTH